MVTNYKSFLLKTPDYTRDYNDKITKIKLTEAVNQIDNLTTGKVVKEKQVLTLMRYYELVKEIKNVHKS